MRTLVLYSIFAAYAAAQSPAEPAPILQIVRMPADGAAAVRPYSQSGAGVNVVGMAAITGEREIWLVEAHWSFASIERLDQMLPPTAGPSRAMIAVFRPNWSYRPSDAMRAWLRARYVRISLVQIRPGTEEDFGELVRLRRAAAESVNLNRPDLAYKVVSGSPNGTFVFVTPLVSLRVFDEGVAALPVYAEELAAARAKDGGKITFESELSQDNLLLRVEPRISSVSDAFAESDPEFWRGQPGR